MSESKCVQINEDVAAHDIFCAVSDFCLVSIKLGASLLTCNSKQILNSLQTLMHEYYRPNVAKHDVIFLLQAMIIKFYTIQNLTVSRSKFVATAHDTNIKQSQNCFHSFIQSLLVVV